MQLNCHKAQIYVEESYLHIRLNTTSFLFCFLFLERNRGMAFGFQKTARAVKKTGWMDGRTDRQTDR